MRSVRDIEWLRSQIERSYALGGPNTPEGDTWDPDEWAGFLLACLVDPTTTWPEVLAEAAIASAADLRALLRLGAAKAALYTIDYALGDTDADEALEEIEQRQRWLFEV